MHLTWGASIDGGTPATGLAGYTIERGSNATGPWTVLQSAYGDIFYDDTAAGWSTTWYYHVGPSTSRQRVGPRHRRPGHDRRRRPPQHHGHQQQLRPESTCGCRTRSRSPGTRRRAGVTARAPRERVKKNGKTVTWSNVPGGIYNVYYSLHDASSRRTCAERRRDASAGDGTATYP